MCGRFANSEQIEVMTARLSAEVAPGAEAWQPSMDVRPTQRAPVLLGGTDLRLGLMTWGWRRDFATGGRIINARWETATEKRAFAHAVESRRCVVPASGYYEWHRDDADRPIRGGKHAFRPADGGMFLIAGLWETTLREDGSRNGHFLVLTRAMVKHAAIHDRTPVMLTDAGAEAWLDPTAPLNDVLDAARSMTDDDLVVRPVCDGPTKAKPAGPHLMVSTGEPWPW